MELEKGRRRVLEEEEEDGVDEGDRRKRAPPADFVRTQFGNPVHLTGGWGRNASDVLMQAAAEQAKLRQQQNAGGVKEPMCRVCEVPQSVVKVGFDSCRRCRRLVCAKCTRVCQRCSMSFCEYCSTNNYKIRETRLFCVDCDLLES